MRTKTESPSLTLPRHLNAYRVPQDGSWTAGCLVIQIDEDPPVDYILTTKQEALLLSVIQGKGC